MASAKPIEYQVGEYLSSGSSCVVLDNSYLMTGSWPGMIYRPYDNVPNVQRPVIEEKYECHFCGTEYEKHLPICQRCGGNKLSIIRKEISKQFTRKLLRLEKTEDISTIYYKLFYSDYSYEIIYFTNSELMNVAEYRDTSDYVLEVLSRAANTDISNLKRIFYA